MVSTKLAIPGAQLIAIDFYYITRSMSRASFWISKKELI
jgi:hypothetical protein